MITEKDLQEAIAECQGQRNPNANTAIKLAAFLTIQREMFGGNRQEEQIAPVEIATGNFRDPTRMGNGYSYAPAYEPPEKTVEYYSGTDFSEAVQNLPEKDVWPIVDELVSVIQATNPRLYRGFMQKISTISEQ